MSLKVRTGEPDDEGRGKTQFWLCKCPGGKEYNFRSVWLLKEW